MDNIKAYKNLDNDYEIQLFEKGEVLSQPRMASITKVCLEIDNVLYCSDKYPTSFNYIAGQSTGTIIVKIGKLPIKQSYSVVSVIVYFNTHTSGIKFFEFKLTLE